jgi:hypothetical protein
MATSAGDARGPNVPTTFHRVFVGCASSSQRQIAGVSTSDTIAAASLFVTFVALGVAWYAVWRANRTTSAATLVTLNEGFRSAWGRFFSANEQQKTAELAELLNLFEIACAIRQEGSVSGNSAELLREYLDDVLRLLTGNAYICERVGPLLQNEATFIFVRRFLKDN